MIEEEETRRALEAIREDGKRAWEYMQGDDSTAETVRRYMTTPCEFQTGYDRTWEADPHTGIITGCTVYGQVLGTIIPGGPADYKMCVAALALGEDPIAAGWEDGAGTPCVNWLNYDDACEKIFAALRGADEEAWRAALAGRTGINPRDIYDTEVWTARALMTERFGRAVCAQYVHVADIVSDVLEAARGLTEAAATTEGGEPEQSD